MNGTNLLTIATLILFSSCSKESSETGTPTQITSAVQPNERSDTEKKETQASIHTPSEVREPARGSGTQAELEGCAHTDFAKAADIAEASGATLLADGRIFVVSDSGNRGAFVILNSVSGEEEGRGRLPMDTRASDDLEGISLRKGRLYGITSSGYVREWTLDSRDRATLIVKSYPVGEGKWLCASARDSNCAMNYEGLCLHEDDDKDCIGFAAAKESGELVCLREAKTGRLVLDPSHRFQVSRSDALSGCDFDESGRLWFGTNFFAANLVGYLENWDPGQESTVHIMGPLGVGFGEAIEVHMDQVFRFSDTANSPSLLSKYQCR